MGGDWWRVGEVEPCVCNPKAFHWLLKENNWAVDGSQAEIFSLVLCFWSGKLNVNSKDLSNRSHNKLWEFVMLNGSRYVDWELNVIKCIPITDSLYTGLDCITWLNLLGLQSLESDIAVDCCVDVDIGGKSIIYHLSSCNFMMDVVTYLIVTQHLVK